MGETISASTVMEALAVRHAKDLFVPECKDGPTWGRNHVRLDAWAMKRSWAHPLTIGYEIKVSRSDFTGDNKWMAYLATCNEFYFAAPKGLISAAEVPEMAGLVELVGTKRLVIRKRAPYREGPLDEALARYVLMSRVRVVSCVDESGRATLAYWQDWAEGRMQAHDIGHRASKRMRESYEQAVATVRHENARLKAENQQLSAVAELLRSIGIEQPAWWRATTILKERFALLADGCLVDQLRGTHRELGALLERLSGLPEDTT